MPIFYKNVLIKRVQTEIHIVCPIDFDWAKNVNFCLKPFGKHVLIRDKLYESARFDSAQADLPRLVG